MKFYFTILFLAIFVMAENASAQSLDVFGGLNFSGLKHKFNGATQESKMTTGYQIGLGVVIPFKQKNDPTDMTGVYPSLQYITKGIKKTTLLGPTYSDIKLNYLQFTIPVYMRAGAYGIGLGPYAALATSGKTEFTSVTGGDRKVNFGSDISDDLKGIDYGLSLTMSIHIFYFQYDFGLANLANGVNTTAKSRNFSFGLLIPLVQN